MAPTPFSESSFHEKVITSLIPIQNKTSAASNSHMGRHLVNGSTRTDIQNVLKSSILQAKRDFEDYAESQRNIFSNNFNDQLSKLDINTKNSIDDSIFTKPSNDFHIIRKGPFFQDPFFEKCRQQFEKSVQDIVTKFGLKNSLISESSSNILNNDIKSNFMNDAFKSYRNLRDTQLQEENQAASLQHEDHQHKIVIDVKDFMGGDIKVNSFNNTIRIEGYQEASSQSPQNSSSSKRNFTKEFTLPGSVNMDSVNSTMSSDGILTITVPRSQPESTARISFPTESDVTQSPSQITQSPSHMAQSPLQMTQSALQMAQLPSHMTQSPSQMTQSPSQMTQSPSETAQSPSQITQSPSQMTHSLEMSHSPLKAPQSPSQITQSPSQITQPPTQITQSPSQMTHSLEMSHSPLQRERHLTIQEIPSDGQADANGATSQNNVTYPEERDAVIRQSFRRRPNGGYWKR